MAVEATVHLRSSGPRRTTVPDTSFIPPLSSPFVSTATSRNSFRPKSNSQTPIGVSAKSAAETTHGYVKIFDAVKQEETPPDPDCPPRCPMVNDVCPPSYSHFRPPSPPSLFSFAPSVNSLRFPSDGDNSIGEIFELETSNAFITAQTILPDEISDVQSDENGEDTGADFQSDQEETIRLPKRRSGDLADEFAGLSCSEGFCNIAPYRRRRPPMAVKRNHRESLGNMADITDDELENDDEDAILGARRLRRRVFRTSAGPSVFSAGVPGLASLSALDDSDNSDECEARVSVVYYQGDRADTTLPYSVEDPSSADVVEPADNERDEINAAEWCAGSDCNKHDRTYNDGRLNYHHGSDETNLSKRDSHGTGQ